MKKLIALLLAVSMVFGSFTFAFAANGGNASGVTEDMLTAEYWEKNCDASADKVLISMEGIKKLNAEIMSSEGTNVYDLENMKADYDADALAKSLIESAAAPKTQYYINGKAIDNAAYFGQVQKDIQSSAYSGAGTVKYAVVSTHADMKAIPTNDMLMDSLTDTADEKQSSSLLLNEPFVIKQKCEREGTTFYWGYSRNCSGWVDGANLAVCKDKQQWLNAWKISDIAAKDFLVVTQDKVYLDRSTDPDYPAGLYLGLGTILKLVPSDKIPTTVGERGTWSNYVVYIPGRNADGSYVQKMGLIAQHYSVSEGFLPYTQANIIKTAFSCQGNRYGWGNMMGNMDCSGYVGNVLRCFGLNFPRNTTTQKKIPGTDVSLSGYKDSEITELIKTLPAGALLYFSGHCMIYLGTIDGIPYVISSVSALSDSEGDVNVVKYLSVLVTPLTIRRGSGVTWLSSLTDAVVLEDHKNVGACTVTAVKTPGQEDSKASVQVYDGSAKLVLGKDYVYIFPAEEELKGYVTVAGSGSYSGLQRVRISYPGCVYTYMDVKTSDWYAAAVQKVVDAGLMKGVSAEKFAPNMALTRGQLAMVLYSYCKSPAVAEDAAGYADVKAGVYYETASKWALSLKLFGERETFGGDDVITREELAAALYALKGSDEEGADLSGYSDAAGLSESSAKAFGWAVKEGIIHGYYDGRLAPQESLTRGQLASVLSNMQQ